MTFYRSITAAAASIVVLASTWIPETGQEPDLTQLWYEFESCAESEYYANRHYRTVASTAIPHNHPMRDRLDELADEIEELWPRKMEAGADLFRALNDLDLVAAPTFGEYPPCPGEKK